MGIFELKYSDQIFKLTACPNITTDSYWLLKGGGHECSYINTKYSGSHSEDKNKYLYY